MWKTYSIFILLCSLVLLITGCDNTKYVYRDGHGTNPKTDVVEIVVSDNGHEYIVLCIDNVGYIHRREEDMLGTCRRTTIRTVL